MRRRCLDRCARLAYEKPPSAAYAALGGAAAIELNSHHKFRIDTTVLSTPRTSSPLDAVLGACPVTFQRRAETDP